MTYIAIILGAITVAIPLYMIAFTLDALAEHIINKDDV